MISQVLEKPPDIYLDEVGECIYCGSRDDLTDEHIIPAGFNGNVILQKASCKPCGAVTSAFESKVLGEMRHFRSGLGLGKKRRKTKPRTAPLTYVAEGTERTAFVPLDQHILPVVFPVYRTPALGDPERSAVGVEVIGLRLIGYGKGPREVGAALGAHELRLSFAAYPVVEFARLLGKIGYAFSVARFGIRAFRKVLVRDAVLGISDDVGQWVGTYRPEELIATDPLILHRVQAESVPAEAEDGSSVTMARAHVQLFASSPSPGYEVIVGELEPSLVTVEGRPRRDSFPNRIG